MSTCSLCELPAPKPPVTTEGVEGTYCCRGCLEVSVALSDLADVDREAVRRRTESGIDRSVPEGAAVAFLAIDGMHCTTCEGFLALLGERAEGIISVEASYATDTARVVYDPETVTAEELPNALSGYGYEARPPDDSADATRRDDDLTQRLVIGAFFSMLVMPWYLFYLYPSYVGIETGILTVDSTTLVGLYLPMVMIGVMTSVVLFYTGYPVLRGAYVSLRVGRPNVDLLVSIAALAAYAYSTVALTMGSTHLYYDVSIAVIMVVTLGTHYERRIKRRANALLADVTAARSREALRRTDEGTETVPLDELAPGDEVLIRPGERVPIDGTVLEGVAAVEEAVLTGESLPVTKRPGDPVIGGSVTADGALVVAVGEDAESTIDRLATAMWEIQSGSPGVQRFADRLATIFVPFVLVLATVVTAWRLAAGVAPAEALLTGLTVLVVSCPCAMGLATPLAVSAGLRDGLRRGIVVTDASVFESAPAVETIVFDKTGTLTAGEMAVRAVYGDERALERSAAVERHSSHPVASAIAGYVDDADEASGAPRTEGLETETLRADGGALDTDGRDLNADDENRDAGDATTSADGPIALRRELVASDFERHPGEGVSATVEGTRVVVGTPVLVERLVGPVPDRLETRIERAHGRGELPVVVGYDGRARAVAVVGDRERAAWKAVLEEAADREVVILTGDDESATARFRDHPAVDRVFAGVPPDGKVETVRRLTEAGVTAMVGDGTNDAPALAAADVGIAMGSGTARATDAAAAVLASSDLRDVGAVFELAAGTRRRIRENVCWALCYNAVAIPLAAAGAINPLFAAVAMAASSLLVVTNSSRPVLAERDDDR